MEYVLRIKFARAQFKAALLATGASLLIEHNEVEGRDTFWSDNYVGNGQNRLGRLLVCV
jgi:predicted NAD-dependent protein-ADP-ribosyltransferase YbiA (DUF1768 family)